MIPENERETAMATGACPDCFKAPYGRCEKHSDWESMCTPNAWDYMNAALSDPTRPQRKLDYEPGWKTW